MSAPHPPDGERFDADDLFKPFPIADDVDERELPLNAEDAALFNDEPRPNPLAGMTPDERVEYTRDHLIRSNPDMAGHWYSEAGDAFLRRMDAIENGPYISTFKLLLKGGAKLPSPESIADDEVTCALWAVIGELAARRIFITSTDHLSDRQLYEHLWFHSLREGIPEFQPDPSSAWVIDVIGSGSEDDMRIMHTYYADDESRADWFRDFPDDEMPAKLPKPYDRDRFLPKAEDAWRDMAEEPLSEADCADGIDDDSDGDTENFADDGESRDDE